MFFTCRPCCECNACRYAKADCLTATFNGFAHITGACHECNYINGTYTLTRFDPFGYLVSASVADVPGGGFGAALQPVVTKYADSSGVVSSINVISGGSGYTESARVVFDILLASSPCVPIRASLTFTRIAPEILAGVSSEYGAGALLSVSLSGPSGSTNNELWGVGAVAIASPGANYKEGDELVFTATFRTVSRSQAVAQVQSVSESGGILSISVIDSGEYYKTDSIAAATVESGGEIWPINSCEYGWVGCPSCGFGIQGYPDEGAERWIVLTAGPTNRIEAYNISYRTFNNLRVYGPLELIFVGTQAGPPGGWDEFEFEPESFLNPVTGVSVTDGGSGYSSPPVVEFDETHGTGAKATASISGYVSSIALTKAGSGYSANSPPTVHITGDGSGASATANVSSGGTLDSISLSSGGSGYSAPPTVSFSSEQGSGAEATAALSASVESVTVTDGGAYSQAPSVVFLGGATSAAAASVTISSERKGCYANGTVQINKLLNCATKSSPHECTVFPESIVATLSGFGWVRGPGGFGREEVIEACPVSDGFSSGPNQGQYDPVSFQSRRDATVVLDLQPGADKCQTIVYSGTYPLPAVVGTAPIDVDCDGASATVTVSLAPSPAGPTVYIAPPTKTTLQSKGALAAVSSVSGGAISSIEVTDAGAGYAYEIEDVVEPEIIAEVFTSTGSGASFGVTLESYGSGDLERWSVKSVSVTNGGKDYGPEDYLMFSAKNGIAETEASNDWKVVLNRFEPTVVASPIKGVTLGSGAQFSVSLTKEKTFQGYDIWSVSSVGVTSAGSGYYDNEFLEFSCPAGITLQNAVAQMRVDRYEPTIEAEPDGGIGAVIGVTLQKTGTGVNAFWSVQSLSVIAGGAEYAEGSEIVLSTNGIALEAGQAFITKVSSGAITEVSLAAVGKYYATKGEVQSVSVLLGGQYYATDGTITSIEEGIDGGAYYATEGTGVVHVDDPSVVVVAGIGAGAVAKANIDSSLGSPTLGRVTSISIEDGGEGYVSPGEIGWKATLTHAPSGASHGEFRHYTKDSAGVLATGGGETPIVTATVAGGAGAVLSPVMTSIATTPPGWTVGSVIVDSGGSGYEQDAIVIFNNTLGSSTAAAAGFVNVYKYEPVIAADVTSAAGVDVELELTLTPAGDYWAISGIAINDAGSGYVAGDAVLFSLGNNCVQVSAAAATVTSVGAAGEILAISLSSGGQYYETDGAIESVSMQTGGVYYSTQDGSSLYNAALPESTRMAACAIELLHGPDDSGKDYRMFYYYYWGGGGNYSNPSGAAMVWWGTQIPPFTRNVYGVAVMSFGGGGSINIELSKNE